MKWGSLADSYHLYARLKAMAAISFTGTGKAQDLSTIVAQGKSGCSHPRKPFGFEEVRRLVAKRGWIAGKGGATPVMRFKVANTCFP